MKVDQVCGWYGISRQGYYQARQRGKENERKEAQVLELVRALRHCHPRMGVRKLHHELQDQMALLGVRMGRDALFDLLRKHDLLVKLKRNRRRTTFSGYRHFPNLVADLVVTRINQVWVADITYLSTQHGFLYLALITDLFSRFIVGFDLSPSLAAEGTLRALNQAVHLAGADTLRATPLIHHSDHGLQYSAHLYLDLLASLNASPSMGQVGNCYDNAFAERVNGILKLEYGLDALFVNPQQAYQAVVEAIDFYNFKRPHLSLNFLKPAHLYFN